MVAALSIEQLEKMREYVRLITPETEQDKAWFVQFEDDCERVLEAKRAAADGAG